MVTGTVTLTPGPAPLMSRSRKLRSGTYFPEWLLERRKRAESALITVVADCAASPASPRDAWTNSSRPSGFTSVVEVASVPDGRRARRARRPIPASPLEDAGPFTFVAADALTMKVREGGRVINAVVLVATGVNSDGRREVLGLVATSETGAAWNTFFADLVARGLTGVRLVTSTPTADWSKRSGEPARRGLAEMSHPLRGEPDECDTQIALAGGESGQQDAGAGIFVEQTFIGGLPGQGRRSPRPPRRTCPSVR